MIIYTTFTSDNINKAKPFMKGFKIVIVSSLLPAFDKELKF